MSRGVHMVRSMEEELERLESRVREMDQRLAMAPPQVREALGGSRELVRERMAEFRRVVEAARSRRMDYDQEAAARAAEEAARAAYQNAMEEVILRSIRAEGAAESERTGT